MPKPKEEAIRATLPRVLLDMPRDAVEEGGYPSLDAILTEALIFWHQKKSEEGLAALFGSAGEDQDGTARLKALWDEGKASGPPVPFDGESLKARLRERIAARQKRA